MRKHKDDRFPDRSADEGNVRRDSDAEPPESIPVEVPITDELDLHSMPPRDIPDVVVEYLWVAAARGFREVRIVHGKGIGVQKNVVAGVLEKHPAVQSFHLAPADRGHYGATIAYLRARVTRSPGGPGGIG